MSLLVPLRRSARWEKLDVATEREIVTKQRLESNLRAAEQRRMMLLEEKRQKLRMRKKGADLILEEVSRPHLNTLAL